MTGSGALDRLLRYPEVAGHLAACGPCAQDLAGLLTAIAGDAQER